MKTLGKTLLACLAMSLPPCSSANTGAPNARSNEGAAQQKRRTLGSPEATARELLPPARSADPAPAPGQKSGPKFALEQYLAGPLLRPGPRDLLWWQWLALPLIGLIAWAVGSVLSRLSRAATRRIAARSAARWGEAILPRIGGPLTLAWALLIAQGLVDGLGLSPPAEALTDRALRAGLLFALFWSLLRAVDMVVASIAGSPWAKARPGSRSLLPITGRMAKVLVVAMAAVTVLSELGLPVASLVAGVGVGGLALALALVIAGVWLFLRKAGTPTEPTQQ